MIRNANQTSQRIFRDRAPWGGWGEGQYLLLDLRCEPQKVEYLGDTDSAHTQFPGQGSLGEARSNVKTRFEIIGLLENALNSRGLWSLFMFLSAGFPQCISKQ